MERSLRHRETIESPQRIDAQCLWHYNIGQDMSRRRMRATHARERDRVSPIARQPRAKPKYTFILLYVFNDAEAVNLLISNNIMTGPVSGARLACV